ncbi:MAG: biotin/lipoyl-binding protein [Lachnospiraceae bacterium]|nr:biotin/lipoyl-binding protein [Lachnospiraceae bacterium]
MKNYRITVNGTAYDVAVEELAEGAVASQPVAAPKAAPAAPKAAPKAAPAAGAAGAVKVNAPMPGKVLSVKAAVGQAVKKGDVLLVLEAMKMENEIVAPQDGTVASIQVSAGQSVEAGDVLASLN